MNEGTNAQVEIDLIAILKLLKRYWALLFISAVVCAVIGYFGTKFLMVPQYEASVNMIVNTRTDNTTTVSNDNINSAKSLVDTYAIIVKGNTVLNDVIDNLGLTVDGERMKYKDLYDKVTVSAIDSTQVMKITVTDPDPLIAVRIVKEISTVSPNEIVEAVEAGSCKVISQVEATEEPVSPSKAKNTAIAAMIGLIVAVAIIVIRDLVSNYVVDDDDIAKYLGISVIGVIPEIEEGKD